ncbi:MAG: tRNA epoxyqueuosine(34) reductase QueG [Flavobacteriales bacterium]
MLIKLEAQRLGFSFCGISKADFLEEEAHRLEAWLNQSMHGQMHYMTGHFDKRLDPRLLVPGAKSVISLLFNYFSDKDFTDRSISPLSGRRGVEGETKISKYAYGEDYHRVVKDKLKELSSFIKTTVGDVHGRAFVDSAPVLDKAWAAKSGLGWIGKNTNLINKQQGSFFFIAELIIDLELTPDAPIKDYCGTCTACIDACPTDAIVQPYMVDGSKCISYFTIELRDAIPADYQNKLDNWIFGCDVCQDVCPWNRFSKPHEEPRFTPRENILSLSKQEWLEMTDEVFEHHLKDSPISRVGLQGMKRNVQNSFNNAQDANQDIGL